MLFAYGGWQTASFMTGEMRNPAQDLARALLLGVIGVTIIYLSVNVVCLRTLGVNGLADTMTPAYTVMQKAIGARGALFMAFTIAVSTLGFLSQGMLTAPRVYFAMAHDGLFFRWIAWLPESTRAPVAAIALQGLLAVVIALSGRYEQILNYVVSIDFIFFGLTGASLFVFRRRASGATGAPHPGTSVHYHLLCRGLLAGRAGHFLSLSREQLDRFRPSFVGHSRLLLLAPEADCVMTQNRVMSSAYMEWVKTQTACRVQSRQ